MSWPAPKFVSMAESARMRSCGMLSPLQKGCRATLCSSDGLAAFPVAASPPNPAGGLIFVDSMVFICSLHHRLRATRSDGSTSIGQCLPFFAFGSLGLGHESPPVHGLGASCSSPAPTRFRLSACDGPSRFASNPALYGSNRPISEGRRNLLRKGGGRRVVPVARGCIRFTFVRQAPHLVQRVA